MATNTLIAFCVGLNFALAVIVVLGAFADRKHRREVDFNTKRIIPPKPIPPPTPPPPPIPPPEEAETHVDWPQRETTA